VLPAIVPLLKAGGRLIVLIKPQFEVGKGEVGSGGIVRDVEKRARVIEEVNRCATDLGLENIGVIESPIKGAEGNVEFLAIYRQIPDSDLGTG
jgi:23S rRNA (cytidine1920-2'-O)/16S rRNA (cytidine1409-2'-O)-methyltransferase